MQMNQFLPRRCALQHIGATGTIVGLQRCASRASSREHVVLVRGAWHGACCWNKLTTALEAQGHRVTAVELPGRRGSAEALASLTAYQYVATVVQILDTSPRPVGLVGHSLGGATISLVAEARPDKVKTLTYLTAFMVPAGKTVGSIGMADKETLISKVVQRDATTGVLCLNPAYVRELFYQDCSDEDIAYAQQRVNPEPPTMGAVPMRITDERFGARGPGRHRVPAGSRHRHRHPASHAVGLALPRSPYDGREPFAFFSDPVGLAKALNALALRD